MVDAGLGIEVWAQRHAEEPELSLDDAGRLREICVTAPFVTMHTAYSQWRFDPSALREEIERAQRVGASALVLHIASLGIRKDGTGFDANETRGLAAYAAERGVRLLLENGRDSHQALDRVLDELGDDPDRTNLGICIDIGHAHASTDLPGDPVLEHLRRYRGALRHLHLHDNNGSADDHRGPGDGTIDWTALLKALKHAQRRLPAVLEVHAKGDEALGAALAAECHLRMVAASLDPLPHVRCR